MQDKTTVSGWLQMANEQGRIISDNLILRELMRDIHNSLAADPNDGNRAWLPVELVERIEKALKK